jgi:glycosyltransferase involved in cell wall biosynthesis
MKLTLFTPSYNRANTLRRLYDSLTSQNSFDFEWLIIDDGSTDNTCDVVNEFIENGKFPVSFYRKTNGGKHTAHNTAYENIDTELNVCIDSNDCLAENAVKKIIDKWNQVKNQGYAGIIGLDADFDGNIIGNGFPSDLQETTRMGYYANGGSGDKKLVYRTDIINKYPPYPVFPGERYVALGYKYRLIDQEYKLAVLNEVLCNVEYQFDGSSNNMLKQYLKNPNGFTFWRKVCMQYPESKKRVFMDCIHYVSSSIIAKNRQFIKESPLKFKTFLAIPFGILLTLYIKFKAKK